ncbi:MAG: FKBP-type peptidyl-prolyl cis-trans isomerase [Flavisolibacter sp.]|jgi:FKBP-type peptidyl-prolyl cis-trans isomerase
MKKCLLLLSSFFVLFAQAQKTTKKPVPQKTASSTSLKNLNDSASYAIGVSVANFYNQQGLKNINSSLVAKAISDVYGKKKTLMTESQCNDVMTSLMNKAQEDMNKAQAEKAKPNITAGEAFLAKNKLNPAVKTTASGLQYEVITEGKGPKPLATDTVTVNYKGSLINGVEFDNSYTRGEPATFPLNHVIPGWTEGVQLMTTGSKYKFYIPYQLGYGLNGTGPIPGGSVLVFEVELLAVNGKK